jgi:hypothetical protein
MDLEVSTAANIRAQVHPLQTTEMGIVRAKNAQS